MLYLQGLLELLGFKMPLYKPSQIFFFTNKNKQNFSYKGVNSSENNPCNSCKKVKSSANLGTLLWYMPEVLGFMR